MSNLKIAGLIFVLGINGCLVGHYRARTGEINSPKYRTETFNEVDYFDLKQDLQFPAKQKISSSYDPFSPVYSFKGELEHITNEAFTKISGKSLDECRISITFGDLTKEYPDRCIDGYCDRLSGEIVIRRGSLPIVALRSIGHELGHLSIQKPKYPVIDEAIGDIFTDIFMDQIEDKTKFIFGLCIPKNLDLRVDESNPELHTNAEFLAATFVSYYGNPIKAYDSLQNKDITDIEKIANNAFKNVKDKLAQIYK